VSATLAIYQRLIAVQIRSQLQYRVAFWFDMVSTALITVAEFVALALVFGSFAGLGGWSLPEVAFLYGLVEMAFGTMDMLFSGFDPQSFGQQIRRGSFDQVLLRPVSITVQVLGSQFVIRRLGRIVEGAVIFAIAVALVGIQWTPLKVLYLPFVLAGLVAFFGGLFMIGATITFWTVESIEVINIFTYGGSYMMSFPMHIYPGWMRMFFTYILPAIFLAYYPALFIMGKPDPFGLAPAAYFLAPVAGLSVLAAAGVFWQFGIRHYQSTGS
jgi:ABC-2 type transport system permease protein